MPDSSSVAAALNLAVLLLIMLSTLSFVLSTLPAAHRSAKAQHICDWVEAVAVVSFTVEYLLKLCSAPRPLLFLVTPMSLVDVLAVLPWYISLALGSNRGQGTQVFRVLRLGRLLRLGKLGGRYRKIQLVLDALRESLDLLWLMLIMLSICIVLFSTLLWISERGEYSPALGYYVRPGDKGRNPDGSPKETPFSSIPAGFWWAIVTLLTVGYGDVVPISVAGKLVAGLATVMGVLCLSLPIAVIGSNFTQCWMNFRERLKVEQDAQTLPPSLIELEELLQQHAANLEDLAKLSGTVDQQIDALRSLLQYRVKVKRDGLSEDKADKDKANANKLGLFRLVSEKRRSARAEARQRQDATSSVLPALYHADDDADSLLGEVALRERYIHDLLLLATMLRSDHIHSRIKECRNKYKVLQELKETCADLKMAVETAESECDKLDIACARLQQMADAASHPSTASLQGAHAWHTKRHSDAPVQASSLVPRPGGWGAWAAMQQLGNRVLGRQSSCSVLPAPDMEVDNLANKPSPPHSP